MIMPETYVDVPTVQDGAKLAFGASHDHGYGSFALTEETGEQPTA
jgi:hypothetical protein